MRTAVFHIDRRSNKRKWLACTLALVAMAYGAWSLLATQPPRTGVVVLPQPQSDSASFKSASPFGAPIDTVTASAAAGPAAPKPATAAVPRIPARPQSTAASTATEDPEALAMYGAMDAKLRPGAPVPDWAPVGALVAEVSRAESNTTVSRVACAEAFCRLDVKTASGMDQSALVETLITPLAARGSALMFRYPQDQANQVVVYMLKPEPNEPATTGAKVNP